MKNYFTNEAIEKASNQEKDSRDILIYMNPQDFLSVAMSGHSSEKMDGIKNLISENIQFNEIPFLNFIHDGEGTAQVTGHEGRHRAKILIELGIHEMPVLLRHRYDENGQAMLWHKMSTNENTFFDMWPERIYGERGDSEETNRHRKNYIDFPIHDLRVSSKNTMRMK